MSPARTIPINNVRSDVEAAYTYKKLDLFWCTAALYAISEREHTRQQNPNLAAARV